ncbi:MAG: glycosyltransferase, partial [Plesiomonas sp.]
QQARGELVCLLNNDTEVISPDWLDEMVSHLLRPGIGVVGARLLYSNGLVQHAGDAVGPGGCADHFHNGLAEDAPGYQRRAVSAQELSAVTGACLLTRKDIYLSLGGLEEQHLPVAFNDVDYCLRVGEAGWRVVWTPFAELFHHESVSRGVDMTPQQLARSQNELCYMKKRWAQRLRHDPAYNPNLSYDRPDFSLSHSPNVVLPWMK